MWMRFRENPTATATAVSVLSALTGAGLCYQIASKRLELKYEAMMVAELEREKDIYARLYKRGEYQNPTAEHDESQLLDEAVEALKGYQTVSKVPDDEPVATEDELIETEKIVNVFDRDISRPDPSVWAEDQANMRPYVITTDDFMSAESDYTQLTVTYFARDGVLIDEREEVIDDVDKAVGRDNMMRFGHGSGDESLVYIRNDVLETDFEVIRSDRSYSEDVLGLDPTHARELKHSSDHRPRRKMRVTDE